MKSRVRIVLASVAAGVLFLGLVAMLVRTVPIFFGADIEPIPAPGSSAVTKGAAPKTAVRRTVPMQRAREEVVGVGMAIRVDPQYGAIRIMQVISNSPASRAGLEMGWIVDKIDDQSTAGVPLSECVSRLRGPIGTKVRLELTSPDLEHTNVVELTRQRLRF